MLTVVLRNLGRLARGMAIAALIAGVSQTASGQNWTATQYIRFTIENVTVTPASAAGAWDVKVVFAVVNPNTGTAYDIKTNPAFALPSARLTMDFGWDLADFTNTGSENPSLAPVVTPVLGKGAAIPVQQANLQTAASRCATTDDCPGAVSLVNRFWVQRTLTPIAFTRAVSTGRVAFEGRALCNGAGGIPGCPVTPPATGFELVPVRSAVANIAFTDGAALTALIPDARRPIVDIAKCQGCHRDGGPAPRLSLHGSQRNENLALCVMCHNPNQTDVPYRFASTTDPRVAGPEVALDFKSMIHAIHAGGFRKSALVIVGFNSSVNDFSGVRFPSELRDCLKCHVEVNGRGTFELPLPASTLGTTVKTQSNYLTLVPVPAGATRTVDVDPRNDLKITPTAAVCASCHDETEARSHMVRTGGASFGTLQDNIGTSVRERCANCHGPGRDKDVRRVHQISRGEETHDD